MKQTLEETKAKLSEIFPTVDYFAEMGYGQDFNFALDPKSYILEKQIRALKKMGLIISQIQYVFEESGMRNHLHIHISKIEKWDEDFKQ